MTPIILSAAERLQGHILDGGWEVKNKLDRAPDATGGCFSVGYIVEHKDGRKGFLKALDYAAAFNSKTTPISVILQQLTESINFEKYVLARCRDRGLDKIVISIADGTLNLGTPGIETVEYLIFELADCDSRRQMSIINKLDVLWRIDSLHQIANGLEQLHKNGIFHQDLKPSNVLVFKQKFSKLADLGRSACEGQNPPHATCTFPGDYTYAPPDALYGFTLGDRILRQLSFDAYLLGSMVVYFFTGVGITALILEALTPPYNDWEHFSGDLDDLKTHLRHAFAQATMKFTNLVPESLRAELIPIVQQLCDPEPERRGHPSEKRGLPNQFSLVRYVSRFNLLRRRLEVGLIKVP